MASVQLLQDRVVFLSRGKGNGTRIDSDVCDPENHLLRKLLIKEIVAEAQAVKDECTSPAIHHALGLADKLVGKVAATSALSLSFGSEDDSAVELIVDHRFNGRRLVYIIAADGESLTTYFVGGPRQQPRRSKVRFAPVVSDLEWVLTD